VRTAEEKRTSVAKSLRKRKVRLKKMKICQDCGIRPIDTGKTLCLGCLDSRREREKVKRGKKEK